LRNWNRNEPPSQDFEGDRSLPKCERLLFEVEEHVSFLIVISQPVDLHAVLLKS
jgi:hypothetical protein